MDNYRNNSCPSYNVNVNDIWVDKRFNEKYICVEVIVDKYGIKRPIWERVVPEILDYEHSSQEPHDLRTPIYQIRSHSYLCGLS